jgi:hypothetical protein
MNEVGNLVAQCSTVETMAATLYAACELVGYLAVSYVENINATQSDVAEASSTRCSERPRGHRQSF